MLEAAFWGFVAGASLLIGAVIGITSRPSSRVIGLVMGFGAGVLISAVAFELTAEAIDRGGGDATTAGLAAGSLAFFAGDLAIDRRGGERRKSAQGQTAGGAGLAIALGALMDGIPESAAIGVTLIEGGGVGVAMVVAVFLSNLPEAISASVGMRNAGRRKAWILALWGAVTLASTLAAALGFGLLDGASQDLIAVIQAFAAGAILTMLADTMMPEAFEYGGNVAGLVTTAGFILAALLSTVE
jgi:zinc transporter, ZIP family